MRVALTCPTYWPYVKRGERFVNGLAQYLVKQGHEVTIITSKPGRPRKVRKEGITILYNREFSNSLLSTENRHRMFGWSCFRSLLQERYDIIQSLFYTDAFGASMSRHFTDAHSIFYVPNCEPFHWGSWVDKCMFERVIRSAVIVAPSVYLQKCLREEYGLEEWVIPPGVDTTYFRRPHIKDLEQPKILCMVAELRSPRKRVPLLIKAFERFKAAVPGAILQLSGRIDRPLSRQFLELVNPKIRDSIMILGVGREEDIPSLYANAAMTVLPSIKEPFGMVLVESLSAGTPVVGTRDGGIPEIIDNDHVGVMFDDDIEQPIEERLRLKPDTIEALHEAMLKCLALAKNRATASRCYEHGMRYDWSVIGSQLEELYDSISKTKLG
jgi:glycosyltransferase involved in cell wall biosynthesis